MFGVKQCWFSKVQVGWWAPMRSKYMFKGWLNHRRVIRLWYCCLLIMDYSSYSWLILIHIFVCCVWMSHDFMVSSMFQYICDDMSQTWLVIFVSSLFGMICSIVQFISSVGKHKAVYSFKGFFSSPKCVNFRMWILIEFFHWVLIQGHVWKILKNWILANLQIYPLVSWHDYGHHLKWEDSLFQWPWLQWLC